MCLAVYAGMSQAVPPVPFGKAFSAEAVPADHPVRRQLGEPHVYRLGAHEGCGCGFRARDDDEPEQRTARAARQALRAFLAAALALGPVTLVVAWSGDESAPAAARRELELAALEDGSHWERLFEDARARKVVVFGLRAAAPHFLSTTAGEIPLHEYHLRLQHSWRILHTGAVLSREEELRFLEAERLPYGVVLWPAAIALAHEVAARPFGGLRVLEIGAGTGLPGIVAASLGAHVVQTDRYRLVLHVCKMNAERNGVTTIEHREADWTAWNDESAYDCILGSDVLYGDAMHPYLRRIFDKNLAPGGRILVSDPFRPASIALLEAMELDGWSVTMNKWSIGIASPERPVGVFELRRAQP